LEYAQFIKKRKGRRLREIVKKVIFGKNIEEKEISTSLLERQNLTFRHDNNRVSRKIIGFSKKVECLISRMMLYCTHFYCCIEHSGLAYEDERGIKCKNTPEREAKITESKLKLRD